MAFESGSGIFFKFPFGDATSWTDFAKPLVPEPTGRPAVTGIIYDKGFITMSGNPRLISNLLNSLDTMQYAFSRRP